MNLKPSTKDLYKNILEAHLIPQWGIIKTAQIQIYAWERLKKVGSKTIRNEIALKNVQQAPKPLIF